MSVNQNDGMGVDLDRHIETCPHCGAGIGDDIKFRATYCPNCELSGVTTQGLDVSPARNTIIPPRTGQGDGVRIHKHKTSGPYAICADGPFDEDDVNYALCQDCPEFVDGVCLCNEIDYSETLSSQRDDVGFTHPNLHRRIKMCECMKEWYCTLHKNIGPCNCRPTIECVCHLITDSDITGIEYAVCSDWDIAESGVPHAICVDGPFDVDDVNYALCEECPDFVDGECLCQPAEGDANVTYAVCIDCIGALLGVDCAFCTEDFEAVGRYTARKRPNEGYKVGIRAFNSTKTTDVHLHYEEQTNRENP
jgi:hypothetical protein